ncbi:MAG: hypothetical protein ABIN89_24465 [Chitinophagaceae bacterium]
MKPLLSLLVLIQISCTSFSQNQVPSPELQIKLALLAAPADKRDSAAVYGYSENKEFIVLRKGLNEFVCLTDDPDLAGFSVACYHRDLEPFMKRGRDLKKEGKVAKDIFDIREKEVKAGTLIMPKQPSTLYVYSTKQVDYNTSSGEIKNGYLRSVIYIPYATAQSTGLSLKPEAPGMPWIMNPGTHGAHIMINPPVVPVVSAVK